MERIFGYLPTASDLGRARMVCTHWRSVAVGSKVLNEQFGLEIRALKWVPRSAISLQA